jgi:hypothetical protein
METSSKKNKVSFLVILLSVLLPPTLYSLFQVSLAVGTGLISLLLTVGYFLDSKLADSAQRIPAFKKLIWISFFLIFHAILINVNEYKFDYSRMFISLWLLLINIIGAGFISLRFNDLHRKSILVVFWFLVFLVFTKIIDPNPLGLPFQKPVVIFSETSHFIIVFLPFTLAAHCVSIGFSRKLIVVIATAVTILVQSVTGLFGLLVYSVVVSRNLIGLPIYVGFIVLTLLFGSESNLEYVVTRIDLSGEITNISTLVWLSGWERALQNFIDSKGVGLGFQQLGLVGQRSISQEVLDSFNLGELNNLDGGTLGSKVVSEFGIFGFVLLLLYLWQLIRAISLIRVEFVLRHQSKNPGRALALGLIIMSVVEILIRGGGYFSGTILALCSALFYVNNVGGRSVISK